MAGSVNAQRIGKPEQRLSCGTRGCSSPSECSRLLRGFQRSEADELIIEWRTTDRFELASNSFHLLTPFRTRDSKIGWSRPEVESQSFQSPFLANFHHPNLGIRPNFLLAANNNALPTDTGRTMPYGMLEPNLRSMPRLLRLLPPSNHNVITRSGNN